VFTPRRKQRRPSNTFSDSLGDSLSKKHDGTHIRGDDIDQHKAKIMAVVAKAEAKAKAKGKGESKKRKREGDHEI
jgi:hypothetical protein